MFSMTSPVDVPYALSYRLPIGHEPLNCLVSDIFSIKVADGQTDRQTDTHTYLDTPRDNRGSLKACSARANNDF